MRLVDKAIDEYCEARNRLLAQIDEGQRSVEEMREEGRKIYMFKFIDNMENCISTVRRLLRLFDFLKRNQDGLSFSRTIRKQIESMAGSIVKMRNVLEHVDEKIQNDAIPDHEPVMLKVTDTQDGLIVGGQSLQFSTLSVLIKQLHGLGQTMAVWRAADNTSANL